MIAALVKSIAIGVLSVSIPGPSLTPPSEVGEWLANVVEPIPDADAAWIDPYVAGARVVLIGEEVHGIADHIRLKGEIARRLITHHEFTHIALEDDVFKVDRLDRNLRSESPAPAATLLTDFFWCWNVRELADFLDGLAADGLHPVLVGFDIQSPRLALQSLKSKADDPDKVAAVAAAERLFSMGRNAYAKRSVEEHSADRAVIEKIAEAFPTDAVKREIRHLLRVQALWAVADEHGPRMNARDRGMAESIQDVLQESGRNKVVVFAHNAHAGYTTFYDSFTGGVTPLARHLKDATNGKTLSIGAVFAAGKVLVDPREGEEHGGPVRQIDVPPPDSQAACWYAIPHDRWLLDPAKISAAQLPDAVRELLENPPAGHFNNYGPAPSLIATYDLIVGCRVVTPATPID